MYDSWLVHGTRAVIVDAPRPADAPYEKADIIVTDRPEVTLYMRFADCVPILFYDPEKESDRAWPTRAGSGLSTVWHGRRSKRWLPGTAPIPKDILAGIGPSICVDHYPVGDEVVEQVRQKMPEVSEEILVHPGWQGPTWTYGKPTRSVLHGCGVEQIEISGLCTACDTQHWYSHRAEHGKTGRFGALIALG